MYLVNSFYIRLNLNTIIMKCAIITACLLLSSCYKQHEPLKPNEPLTQLKTDPIKGVYRTIWQITKMSMRDSTGATQVVNTFALVELYETNFYYHSSNGTSYHTYQMVSPTQVEIDGTYSYCGWLAEVDPFGNNIKITMHPLPFNPGNICGISLKGVKLN